MIYKHSYIKSPRLNESHGQPETKTQKNPMGKIGNLFPTAGPMQSHNLWGLKIKRLIDRYVKYDVKKIKKMKF